MHSILVANRGEIAIRIARSARAEGYRSVAVYSEADAQAPHVQAADMAVAIGGKTPAESYLNIGEIITAAKQSGADAVHPGYGFLAENAEFARTCADNGLLFIGPSQEVIELMGNKRRAKAFAEAAGVPCIPGCEDLGDEARMLAEARRIGFPLMIKAAAGGGGRGMRLVESAEAFPDLLRSARSEARSAFGSDEMILEKALLGARHIEIQVFGDQHGEVVHLGERDCSIQRRHQKIVEESPSPAVSKELRARMGEAAVGIARACDYTGAGTVEFLLDAAGNFYFLEMNTRLQVEHGVTELVTGQDLVAWQLAVARGEPLPLSQGEFSQRGHAIEVRLYAEDPQNGFLPQSGRILHWREPQAAHIRVDHALASGLEISPHYDPMLGKVLAWGASREEARRRLCAALEQLEYLGPANNGFFLRDLLRHPVFVGGGADTSFLEENPLPCPAQNPDAQVLAVAALLMHEGRLWDGDRTSGRANWRSGDNSLPLRYRLECGGENQECDVYCLGGHRYRVRALGESTEMEFLGWQGQRAQLLVGGERLSRLCVLERDSLYLAGDGRLWKFRNTTHAPAAAAETAGSGRILAPMDGCVVQLCVAPGQPVLRGDTLAVMEAMKMEHPLKADRDGIVASAAIATGDQVRGGQLLLEISAPD